MIDCYFLLMRRAVRPSKAFGPLLLAFLVQACGATTSGEVRDAASGRPIADARVEVTTVGWGIRDGDLVWDKSFVHAANTDERGRFEIDRISGGVNLGVSARGYRPIDTSLCSRSPNLIRVGGPFDGADLGKQFRSGAGPDGAPLGCRFGPNPGLVDVAAANLSALRLSTSRSSKAWFRAPSGMTFVRGTGNPPSPPASGYVESLEVDLFDCGWLLVRTPDDGMVAVKIGSFSLDDPLEGGHYLALSYGEIPSAVM